MQGVSELFLELKVLEHFKTVKIKFIFRVFSGIFKRGDKKVGIGLNE